MILKDPSQWTIPRIVEAQSATTPDRMAIHFVGGTSWSFRELQNQAVGSAASLKRQGVAKGDTVAVMSNNPEMFVRCWLGLAYLGAVMVAINTGLRGDPLSHQLRLCETKRIITDADLEETVMQACSLETDLTVQLSVEISGESTRDMEQSLISSALQDVRHSDTACVMFTSGTSGPAKGVVMPHAHCVLFAVGTIENLALRADDTFYICLPLFHANGLFMQLLACLVNGCQAVIRAKFSASAWLNDIRDYKATHTNMLGALAAFVVAQPARPDDHLHRLRVVSAAPLPSHPEDVLRTRFGVEHVVPLYGMTEVNIPLYGSLNESAPGTAGRLYEKYFDVEIRNADTDQPVSVGETGELMVRPKQPYGFMSGYLGMPEKTLEAWRNFWFHTGDAAFLREDGCFVFVDRIKDCIRRRGENISSYDVEQAFLALADVTEAAAYAVPAAGEGMEDEVMVSLLTDAVSPDVSQWRELAAQNLAKFAVPRYIRLVDDLPKTQTGKIRKLVLREQGITTDTFDFSKVR